MKKIKRLIRKVIVLYRYKKDSKQNKITYIKQTDKYLGLTKFLIKKSIKYNIPILVPNMSAKKYIAKMMATMGVSYNYAFDNLIIRPNENLMGRVIDILLVDSQCTEDSVRKVIEAYGGIYKVTGFIVGRNK